MLRIFFIRHAEREDHINYEWQETAHRVHDSPLSEHGHNQASKCGEFLSTKLSPSENIHLFSSPLVRCVTTSRNILLSLRETGHPHPDIKIEQGVSESNKYLRGRLTASHRFVSELNKATGKLRSENKIYPVLLLPSDLVGTAYPLKINTGYKSLYNVDFDDEYFELNPSGERVESLHRVKLFITNLLEDLNRTWNRKDDLTYIFVTHGEVLRNLVNCITDKEANKEVEVVDYVHTVEILPEAGQDLSAVHLRDVKFEINDCWSYETGNKNVQLA
eukprot:snap_masked-scaffold_22-processed-gene-4.35-mRNA-1 protein AED:1.00 eAED:1.00 QI:0/-1/0/0/-1/1/1/0/274